MTQTELEVLRVTAALSVDLNERMAADIASLTARCVGLMEENEYLRQMNEAYRMANAVLLERANHAEAVARDSIIAAVRFDQVVDAGRGDVVIFKPKMFHATNETTYISYDRTTGTSNKDWLDYVGALDRRQRVYDSVVSYGKTPRQLATANINHLQDKLRRARGHNAQLVELDILRMSDVVRNSKEAK